MGQVADTLSWLPWALEYDDAGKTWGDFGARKQPRKGVIWRALEVLNLIGEYSP